MAHVPEPQVPAHRPHDRVPALLRMAALILLMGSMLALLMFLGLLWAYGG